MLPPVAIGCCFYKRPGNYQAVISCIEGIAFEYYGTVKAYIYFSGENHDSAIEYIKRLRFTNRELFTFTYGENRFDEPKYTLPLQSGFDFIFTMDDDITFEYDTLKRIMNVYLRLCARDSQKYQFAPVGWFGTELVDGILQLPIEGRYHLPPGTIKEVDYLASCGCLYRREVFGGNHIHFENWPKFIGAASDLWISFLINTKFQSPLIITGVRKARLSEFGHSLWRDINKPIYPAIVENLVSMGWKKSSSNRIFKI